MADEFPLRPISDLKTGPVREAYEICEAGPELFAQPAAPVSGPNLAPMPQVAATVARTID